jgi:Bacterial regulatory proteins, gntR family
MDPLYDQVAALLLGRIRSGEWPAGARLPSEPDLAEFYQVNRDTVRKAVRQLAAEGRLRVVRGRGTYSLGDGQRPALPVPGLRGKSAGAADRDDQALAPEAGDCPQDRIPARRALPGQVGSARELAGELAGLDAGTELPGHLAMAKFRAVRVNRLAVARPPRLWRPPAQRGAHGITECPLAGSFSHQEGHACYYASLHGQPAQRACEEPRRLIRQTGLSARCGLSPPERPRAAAPPPARPGAAPRQARGRPGRRGGGGRLPAGS